MLFLLGGLFLTVSGLIQLRSWAGLDNEDAMLRFAESYRRILRFGGSLSVGAGACMAIAGVVLVITGAG